MPEIIYRNTVDMDPLYKNPRYIKDREFLELCKSIRENPEYFEARPIILSNRTGLLVIIAGNMRHKAAIHEGIKQVPTFLLEGLTEEKEREIIIRDNVSNGSWDYDTLANEGWDKDQLIEWGVPALWDLKDEYDDTGTPGTKNEKDPFDDKGIENKNQYGVIVMCSGEEDQAHIFNRLTGEGYACKVVVT